MHYTEHRCPCANIGAPIHAYDPCLQGGKSTQFSLPKKHMGRVTGVALSPQSAAYVYSCATDGVVAMWDKRYGEKAQASMLQQQPTAQFTSLALRDDGLHVAAGTKGRCCSGCCCCHANLNS